ncbi:MAG: zf-HC2 domain-containing protein, partial [Planctomyces sp.]
MATEAAGASCEQSVLAVSYLDGSLGDERSEAFESHLSACEVCQSASVMCPRESAVMIKVD